MSQNRRTQPKLNSRPRQLLAQNRIPTPRSRVLSPYARRGAGGIHCSGKRLLVDVRVEGKLLRFQVNTGAYVSLIDEPSWKELGEPTLGVTTDRLKERIGSIDEI